jgi:hypothetical protein
MSFRTLLIAICLSALSAPAYAVSVRDIIELTKAGLSDDVLIAVIDADRTIFTLDKEQILTMKEAGVSEAVLLKMLRSRREFDAPVETYVPPQVETVPIEVAAPAPHVVVIEKPAPPVVVTPQYYFYPWIWGRPSHRGDGPQQPAIAQPFMAPDARGFGRFINDGWIGRP